jgi:NAD(P)H-hydrate repair Nnr-like enzyme with NAD(P)H-hydrate dehydratase domain
MPNPAEAARMLGRDIERVLDEPEQALFDVVDRYPCTVALRGSESWITAPQRPLFHDTSGTAGLAASGSGDVLAGLLVGFAARGAVPLDALLWAVHVHGVAGERCAEAQGDVGFLAREVADAVPAVLRALG